MSFLRTRQLLCAARAAAAAAPRRPAARPFSSAPPGESLGERNARLGTYAAAVVVGVIGVSYASVPLYKVFCQATGYGGTTQQATEEQFKSVRPVPGVKLWFDTGAGALPHQAATPQARLMKVLDNGFARFELLP